MSFAETVLLGALAGFTIDLGVPLARLPALTPRPRVALAMFAVGVLAFLFVDVMSHGGEILEDAVNRFGDGRVSFGHVLLLGLLLAAGFGAGTAGLGVLERRMRPRRPEAPPIAGGEAASAVTVEEAGALASAADAARSHALATGLAVAAAIGVHKFPPGLGIGGSAQNGEI